MPKTVSLALALTPKLILCLMLLQPVAAMSHHLSVFAWVEGDTIFVQSKFMGGKPPRYADVKVLDGSGRTLVNGKTDDQGRFSFDLPVRTEMKIVVSAGLGHQGQWVLTQADLAGNATQISGDSHSPSASSTTLTPEAATVQSTCPAAACNQQHLQRVVEQALDSRLAPLFTMIARQNRQRIDIRDILGAIGYIVGLTGIAAYCLRKTKQDK